MSILDYELNPATVHVLKLWQDGQEKMHRSELQTGDHGRPPELDIILNWVQNLQEPERGLVVIDLLTLVDAMQQAVTLMKLDQMDLAPEEDGSEADEAA